MRDKPWQVIDILTDETVAWCETETDAALVCMRDTCYRSYYRPGRKGKVKK